MSLNGGHDEDLDITTAPLASEVASSPDTKQAMIVAPKSASQDLSTARSRYACEVFTPRRSRSVDTITILKSIPDQHRDSSHGDWVGVCFWKKVVSEILAGKSRMIIKMFRFALPKTFIIDPKQSVTGLVYRDGRLEILVDTPPESILTLLKSNEVDTTQSPVALLKRQTGEVGTAVTVLDQPTLAQVVRRIHDSDESSVICIQEYISASQTVRVTYSTHGSIFTGLVISSTSPRVFKLVGSALDGDLRCLSKSVAQFIESVFRVHISTVVVDCVKSSTSWLLLQVKSILVDRPASIICPAISPIASCKSRCGICRETGVSKMITSRMISECRKNLAERYPQVTGVITRLNAIKTSLKCCDECYAMIMNELELVDIAKRFTKFITSPNPVAASSEFWRLAITVHGLSNSPPDLLRTGVRISCGTAIALSDAPKMSIYDFSDISSLSSQIIHVNVYEYTGSVDCLDPLIARARMSPGIASTHKTQVFLGKDTFALSISVGLVWYKASIACGKFTPIPEEWLRRSHSNSKRLFVRS